MSSRHACSICTNRSASRRYSRGRRDRGMAPIAVERQSSKREVAIKIGIQRLLDGFVCNLIVGIFCVQ